MDETHDNSAEARPAVNPPRRGGGKWIGRAFVLLWVVGVIAVYVVIVRLKIGGERALRLPEEGVVEPSETGAERPESIP